MNFIFISPNFPHTYWNFCDRLKKNGVNVLGIGDAPYDGLEDGLKGALTEYYKVDSLENYDQVFRAVAFFSFKYGKIDWIESAGIPTARQSKVTTREAALKFIDQIGGYPVIVKPDIGVGANDTWKLNNDEQLNKFYDNLPGVPYVMEEFIVGDLISYEAILNSKFEPLFENMTTWPTPIMEIVNDDLNLKYYTNPDVPEKLREIGRRTSKEFGVDRRFVHLEFFRLTKARKGLGKKGEYAGLEVNMRPPGGYTPDMMNFAHSTDVYQIYADMVAFDERHLPESNDKYYCVYAGRKDGHDYVHTHEEIMAKYGPAMVMQEEMPPVNWPQMGRVMYTVKLITLKEVNEFISFVHDEK